MFAIASFKEKIAFEFRQQITFSTSIDSNKLLIHVKIILSILICNKNLLQCSWAKKQ
ncbi:hypothetical protein ADICYQ_0080 [Cyclobacterium qasimii M12-11B]|uniref:Uncharacterized protein n=1 Tax=Cyclobacterium qasimii M12-11B TaxID=641524 RepID=S7VR30_9BACT|nr:hypothetical protein ADICYQ_0080 [Cyclobacterium qasimii M12-11B]